jgi:hypothetical protein
MPFLREFEDDIFISYAHIDNQPLAEGQQGWITSFHRALEIRLSQLLGDQPEFWRDESDLRGNDYFNEAIVMRLPKVAILITVLTPRYVKSDWCLREVEEFYRLAEQTGGVRLADKSRIFKIVKTPVPADQHPLEMQKLLGYEFYQTDPATGKPREFIFNSGPNVDINYWAKLDDVAYDVFKLLEALKAQTGAFPPEPPTPQRGQIYLAETTLDLSVERDKIKRELQSHGYRVVPEQPLPLEAVNFEKVVRENLRDSLLSIHLVGANYGVVPEATERSIICLQNELAAERSRDANFSRIIWMPPGLSASETRQQQFITYLCDDSSAQDGAELLQSSLEDLKTLIHDKLNAPVRMSLHHTSAPDDSPSRIYLICDSQDTDLVAPLYDHFFDHGFEVLTPMLEGDEAQARADHRENLMLCDAILIYYGAASEAWLRTKLFDLRKLAGYGRTKPLRAKAVYIAAPATPAKERFRTLEALVIKQPEDFNPESLAPLLTQMSSRRGNL